MKQCLQDPVWNWKFLLLEDRNGSISRLYGVDKVGASHSFRAYFIVDPDQVIMMTMLILRNVMMLRKKMMLLMTVLMMRLMTIEQVAWARVVGDLPVALGIDEMVWQVRNIPSLSSGVV